MTIPMMKRYGYQPSMAAAIEATASTAGQILPPVLGLAGFLIASLLNRPYIEVAMAALIPGLLYLSGSIIGVISYANRRQLPKLTESINYQLSDYPKNVSYFPCLLWLGSMAAVRVSLPCICGVDRYSCCSNNVSVSGELSTKVAETAWSIG